MRYGVSGAGLSPFEECPKLNRRYLSRMFGDGRIESTEAPVDERHHHGQNRH